MFPLSCGQGICHCQGYPFPFFCFHLKLACSCLGEPVKFRAAVICRFAPEGTQPTRFLHTVKGGEQRTWLDQKCSAGDLLDAPRDAQAVKFPGTECLENQEIEGALKEICLF